MSIEVAFEIFRKPRDTFYTHESHSGLANFDPYKVRARCRSGKGTQVPWDSLLCRTIDPQVRENPALMCTTWLSVRSCSKTIIFAYPTERAFRLQQQASVRRASTYFSRKIALLPKARIVQLSIQWSLGTWVWIPISHALST